MRCFLVIFVAAWNACRVEQIGQAGGAAPGARVRLPRRDSETHGKRSRVQHHMYLLLCLALSLF